MEVYPQNVPGGDHDPRPRTGAAMTYLNRYCQNGCEQYHHPEEFISRCLHDGREYDIMTLKKCPRGLWKRTSTPAPE